MAPLWHQALHNWTSRRPWLWTYMPYMPSTRVLTTQPIISPASSAGLLVEWLAVDNLQMQPCSQMQVNAVLTSRTSGLA